MREGEIRIEIPRLRDENEGIPVIACISSAGIRYIAQEERGDVEIGDELWWDHFVAQELADRLHRVTTAYLAAAEHIERGDTDPRGMTSLQRYREAAELLPRSLL